MHWFHSLILGLAGGKRKADKLSVYPSKSNDHETDTQKTLKKSLTEWSSKDKDSKRIKQPILDIEPDTLAPKRHLSALNGDKNGERAPDFEFNGSGEISPDAATNAELGKVKYENKKLRARVVALESKLAK
jgi:hypothetical protein